MPLAGTVALLGISAAAVLLPVVITFWLPKSGLILVPTIAAALLTSALTMLSLTMLTDATVTALGSAPFASLERSMAAEALISALTMTPVAMDVAFPTEVMSPVKLALVVTVDALPANAAVIVPAENCHFHHEQQSPKLY